MGATVLDSPRRYLHRLEAWAGAAALVLACLACLWPGPARAVIPATPQWAVDADPIDLLRVGQAATAMDSAGATYVATANVTSTDVTRVLRKYDANGAEVAGPSGPWYSAPSARSTWDDYVWQQLVLDEPHAALYVLTALRMTGTTRVYVFLQKHDLRTGARAWSSALNLTADRPRAAVDGAGDVWVVRPSTTSGVAFWIDRVRASDGTTYYTPDTMGVSAPAGTQRTFQTVAAAGTRLFITYQEVSAAATQDLVVSVYNTTTFGTVTPTIRSYAWSLPEPADTSPYGNPYCAPNTAARYHPQFFESSIDGSGNLIVAGYYSFYRGRCSGEQFGDNLRYYPVAVEVDAQGALRWAYIEAATTGDAWVASNAPRGRSASVSLAPTRGGGALVLLRPVSTSVYEYGTANVWEVSPSGQRTGSLRPTASLAQVEVPAGSGCRYGSTVEPASLAYHSPGTSTERMVLLQRRSYSSVNTNPASCGQPADRLHVDALVATYCKAQGNPTYEWIRAVTLQGALRSSGANAGYLDASGAAPIPVTQGGAATIALQPGFSGGTYSEFWDAWIDFNHDYVFSADEHVFSGSGAGAVSGSFTVPASAKPGPTTLRVAMRYGGPANVCGGFPWGEVEDHPVEILPASPRIASVTFTTTTVPIGGAGSSYTAALVNPTAGNLSNMVVQGWAEQGSARRAAGGSMVVGCGSSAGVLPPGTCNFAGGLYPSNSAAGSGTLVPGPATAVVELRAGSTVVSTFTVPITLQ